MIRLELQGARNFIGHHPLNHHTQCQILRHHPWCKKNATCIHDQRTIVITIIIMMMVQSVIAIKLSIVLSRPIGYWIWLELRCCCLLPHISIPSSSSYRIRSWTILYVFVLFFEHNELFLRMANGIHAPNYFHVYIFSLRCTTMMMMVRPVTWSSLMIFCTTKTDGCLSNHKRNHLFCTMKMTTTKSYERQAIQMFFQKDIGDGILHAQRGNKGWGSFSVIPF